MPTLIKSKSEFDEKLRGAGQLLVVVDFFAEWSVPCTDASARFQEMEKHFQDAVFLRVNADDYAEIAAANGVFTAPTFKCYKSGKQIFELSGSNKPETDIRTLQEFIETHR